MKTLLIVGLQTNSEHQHLAGWLITLLLVTVTAFVMIRRFLKKRGKLEHNETQYYVPPKAKVATIHHNNEVGNGDKTVQPLNNDFHKDESFHEDDEEEEEYYDEEEHEPDPFEQEAKRLGLVELDINLQDVNKVIVTEKGLYLVNDDAMYCDDVLIQHTDEESWDDLVVTPEGKIYMFDEDSGQWRKPGEDCFWIDYVKTVDEVENHPDGELEILDNEVLLNDKTLYAGQYDSYTAHPNFGVIVGDENRLFINRHLNYEGYYDEFYPDPFGIIVQVENSFFLIRKDIPTPDLMASLTEEEYEKEVFGSDYGFVKNRILTVYSGTLLHENFNGTTWVSQKGLFFIPEDSPGKLYLRDTVVHDLGDDCPVTNVFIDGDEVFVQVDNTKWYRNGKLIFDGSEYHNNHYGTTDESDEKTWDSDETWPDGTKVQSKGDVIFKDGVQFFNAPFANWFMHPKGLVIATEDEEKLFLYYFAKEVAPPVN